MNPADAMVIDAIDARPADAPDAQPIDAAVDAAPQTLDPSQSSLTTDRDVATAGVDTVTITVTLRDTANQPIAGMTVDLGVSGAGNTLTTAPPTDANGTTTATLASTVAETKTISGSVGATAIGMHDVMFVPGPAARLVFLDPPSDVVAGALFSPAIRVAAEDAVGNLVPTASGAMTLTLDMNPGNAQLLGTSSASPTNGIVTFADTHIDVAASGYTIRASSTGLTAAASAAFAVTAGSPDAAHSSLEASPPSLEADGVATTALVAHIANQYGAPISNAQVDFAVTGTNNNLSPASNPTSAAGIAAAILSSTTAETKTVTATVGSLTLSTPVEFHATGCRPQLPEAPWTTLPANPDAVLVSDVDGDGHRDIVLSVLQTIAVYRGHGDGTLFPPFELTRPYLGGISQISAGDVNGDGTQDLVLCEANDFSIEIALGTGGGQFAAPTTILYSAPCRGFELDDIDNNGTLDIVANQFGASQIQTFIGAGDGTFTMGVAVPNAEATDLTLTDVNADGKLDLLYDDTASLTVAFGDGIGGFGAPRSYLEQPGGGTIGVGDLDNDGNLDVVTSSGDWATVMFGDGTGAFHAAGAFVWLANNLYDENHAWTPTSLRIVDVDDDGDLDVIAGSGFTLSILINAGDGTLTLSPRAFHGGQLMAYADIDEDGHDDVVALGDHSFGVIDGLPNGQFVAPDVYPRRDGQMFPVAADFDGNGRDDVLHETSFEGFIPALTNANGSPTDAPAVGTGGATLSLVLEDATGDGNVDIVSASGIWPGRGDGTFVSPPITHGFVVGGDRIAGATFGPDHRADVVITGGFVHGFWIAQTQGDGSFAISALHASASNWVTTGDVNNDGISDVLTADANGDLAVYLGNGLGDVSPPVSYPTHGFQGTLQLGDVDGDSFLDAVTFSTYPEFSIMVMRGLGNGAFGPPLVTPALAIPPNTQTEDVHLADFTGDGALDLAVSTDRGFAIVGGFGDGYFRQHASFYGLAWYTTDSATPSVVISDRNGDGRPDLTFWSTPGIVVGLNAGCTP